MPHDERLRWQGMLLALAMICVTIVTLVIIVANAAVKLG